MNSLRSWLYSRKGLSDRNRPCCPAGWVGGNNAVKLSGGRWSHRVAKSSGILGGLGVMDGVITVGRSGGLGLAGTGVGIGDGSGTGVAQWSVVWS